MNWIKKIISKLKQKPLTRTISFEFDGYTKSCAFTDEQSKFIDEMFLIIKANKNANINYTKTL